MRENNVCQLFISYSHKDINKVERFMTHISPLEKRGEVEIWIDQDNTPGSELQHNIKSKLYSSDIICLFISADYLASPSCNEEKEIALKLRKEKGVSIIPIILSPCNWLDDFDLSSLLAIPFDGKPVSSYVDANNAWTEIIQSIKTVMKEIKYLRDLEISQEFTEFLSTTEMLASAHSRKREITLEDIFIYPELSKYENLDLIEITNLESVIESFTKNSKIVIAGDNQSGKTALCKKCFIELRKKNFLPVFLTDPSGNFHGILQNRIIEALQSEYINFDISQINNSNIVPIIDDFQFAKNKLKLIKELSDYPSAIIIVDDIYSLNIAEEDILSTFTKYRINEFSPFLRNQLIRKWTQLNDRTDNQTENGIYQKIDEKTELVDSALGKVFGSGVMPAYPFFIISIISTYDIFAKPLDQEITSQGYCYQALVFMYLIKNGVKPNEMDTYINFLTEFAFHLFTERKVELPIVEFNAFFQSYQDQYNLPVPEEKLINNLISSKLLCLTDLGNYGFIYNYLYYFFVAKYIADNIEKNKPYVDNILKNLHIDENAYIAIFISHHSKNNYILDELTLNAMCLFDTFCPATLNKKELLFFDEQIEVIANAVLPTTTPETERRKRLSAQQIKEENNKPCNNSTQNNENDLTRNDIRRAVKTVEVMGQVIKNRAGSLKREILEEIFREAILTNLRMLSSFFECIQKKKEQDSIINFITSRIDIVSEKKNDKRRDEGKKSKEISEEELEEIARKVFWNLNFFVVLGIIDKTVKSTGSDQLTQIIIKVCDEIDTPASELIKHGIFMWYSKNLQIDIISDKFDNVDYSFISKQIMRYMIVNHCSLHTVSFKEKQKLEKRFGISHKKLLVAQAQKSQDIK